MEVEGGGLYLNIGVEKEQPDDHPLELVPLRAGLPLLFLHQVSPRPTGHVQKYFVKSLSKTTRTPEHISTSWTDRSCTDQIDALQIDHLW